MRHNDELKYIPHLEIILTGEDGGHDGQAEHEMGVH